MSCIITYQKPKKILRELISEIASQNVSNKFTFQLITGFQFTFGIVRFVIAGIMAAFRRVYDSRPEARVLALSFVDLR